MSWARIMAWAAAIALTAPLLVTSCGKKGPPRPPPRLIPAPIVDLRVRQTADRLVLEMTYPAVTTSGLPLPAVEALEILTLRPRAAGGVVRVEPAMFAVTAQVTKRLEGAELAAATRGAELVIELDAAPGAPMGPLSEAELAAAAASAASAQAAAESAAAATPGATATPTPAAGTEQPASAGTATPTPAAPTATPTPAGPPPILLAVRSFGPRKNESPISNIVAIVPRPAPAPPATLEVEPTQGGIRIAWTAGGGEPPAGYDVLRRKLGETAFVRVAELGADAHEHVDATAVYGDHYEYTVRSVAARNALVESADGPLSDVDFKDTFAPPAPTGLVALAEEGRVRLLWTRVDAADLEGYRLYRQEEGDTEIELPREPGAGADHLDEAVRAGATYSYRVTAVDREDNESAKSEPATATPR